MITKIHNTTFELNKKSMSDNKIPTEFIFVLLAAAGGVARYLSLYIKGDKFRLSMLIANLILSGFSGYIFYLFVRSLGVTVEIQGAAAGIGGFMSTEALKFLAQKIKKEV